MKTLALNSFPVVLAICACAAAICRVEGWGWFLFVALITVRFPSNTSGLCD